jgi:ArsR family transcriptional regulator
VTAVALPLTDLSACCAPASGDVLSEAAAARLAGVLKALAEPTRLRLVSIIAGNAPEAVCVCNLTGPVGLSQPTVSHHLRVLTEAGILEREQRGKWAYYGLVPGALAAVAGAISPAGG